MTEDRGASLTSHERSRVENEGGPDGATNTNPGLDLPLAASTQGGPVMHIAPRPGDNEHQAPADTIPRLQRLLAEAIMAREWALNRLLELEAQTDAHWFVPDETGDYCAACALPRNNGRHRPRKAA